MFESLPASPTLEIIEDPHLRQFDVRMEVLRLDRVHPLVSGNKWFKLRLNLLQARSEGYNCLLSFGGAYSNHLRALAAAARLEGMKSVGVVRGEIHKPLNPVLAFAKQQGMELYAVSRAEYRGKQQDDFIAGLGQRFGRFYLLPEGGSNELGVEGCSEIAGFLENCLAESRPGKTLIAVACGTGATLAGLIRGAQRRNFDVSCLGIAVLKGADFLDEEVRSWLDPVDGGISWKIEKSYHCGGYARSSPELTAFINNFTVMTGIELEPVYTGKLVFALYRMIECGRIGAGTRVLWLHTGGIY
jgi:1-aminocyclopropane-1-carboxylate deaminase